MHSILSDEIEINVAKQRNELLSQFLQKNYDLKEFIDTELKNIWQ